MQCEVGGRDAGWRAQLQSNSAPPPPTLMSSPPPLHFAARTPYHAKEGLVNRCAASMESHAEWSVGSRRDKARAHRLATGWRGQVARWGEWWRGAVGRMVARAVARLAHRTGRMFPRIEHIPMRRSRNRSRSAGGRAGGGYKSRSKMVKQTRLSMAVSANNTVSINCNLRHDVYYIYSRC